MERRDSWKHRQLNIYQGSIFRQNQNEYGERKDVTNKFNINDKTNRVTGNVNRIETTLKEIHLVKHKFKAAKLMRVPILIGGMLTNSDLEKPDLMLQRKYQ